VVDRFRLSGFATFQLFNFALGEWHLLLSIVPINPFAFEPNGFEGSKIQDVKVGGGGKKPVDEEHSSSVDVKVGRLERCGRSQRRTVEYWWTFIQGG